MRADLAHARHQLVLTGGWDAALRKHPANSSLLPGDIRVPRNGVFVVLGAVDTVVPPTITHVGRQRIAELGEQLLPRRTPARRLGQRPVEIEDDGFRHGSSVAQGFTNAIRDVQPMCSARATVIPSGPRT